MFLDNRCRLNICDPKFCRRVSTLSRSDVFQFKQNQSKVGLLNGILIGWKAMSTSLRNLNLSLLFNIISWFYGLKQKINYAQILVLSNFLRLNMIYWLRLITASQVWNSLSKVENNLRIFADRNLKLRMNWWSDRA